jgi:hypothetical protein
MTWNLVFAYGVLPTIESSEVWVAIEVMGFAAVLGETTRGGQSVG